MITLVLGLGPQELIIILVIILLLFGGSRLAGLGKSTGRALKEFKEETKDLGGKKDETPSAPLPPQVTDRPVDAAGTAWPQQPQSYQQPTTAPVPEPSRDDVRRDV